MVAPVNPLWLEADGDIQRKITVLRFGSRHLTEKNAPLGDNSKITQLAAEFCKWLILVYIVPSRIIFIPCVIRH